MNIYLSVKTKSAPHLELKKNSKWYVNKAQSPENCFEMLDMENIIDDMCETNFLPFLEVFGIKTTI
jgi:hypothetical protein